ncbi:unnamed protein product [Spirodela intermedia]|uniref:Uncharacterized protein n=1 Tax=Spirodela intermedia TaxID=51605 RepID=A0A7I8K4R9_SPIIN|nr:unnamed protein product [Spirodela intermedia]
MVSKFDVTYVHGLEGSPWTKTTSIKWLVELSLVAATWRSKKTVILRLSVAITRQRGAGWSKRRLFIASVPFLHVYDHSLSHSRLATSDIEGGWRTCAQSV